MQVSQPTASFKRSIGELTFVKGSVPTILLGGPSFSLKSWIGRDVFLFRRQVSIERLRLWRRAAPFGQRLNGHDPNPLGLWKGQRLPGADTKRRL